MTKRYVAAFGCFTVYEGKLGDGDHRNAFVEGPTESGRIAPLASFWTVDDARRWARERGGDTSK